MRRQKQAAEMRLVYRAAALAQCERLESDTIWEDFSIETLSITLRGVGGGGPVFRAQPTEETPRAEPGHRPISQIHLDAPRRTGRMLIGWDDFCSAVLVLARIRAWKVAGWNSFSGKLQGTFTLTFMWNEAQWEWKQECDFVVKLLMFCLFTNYLHLTWSQHEH